MLDFSFPRLLAQSGFEHRATPEPDGRIVYRLTNKSGHVRVERAEWDRLLEEFSTRVRDIQRGTRKWLIGLFPGIFLFGMTIGQVLPGAGLLIVIGIFLGPPAIYLSQSYRVRGAAEAIDLKLALRNRVAAPPPKPFRIPRALEIASFVLVGPHLLLELWGSIRPETYRNTPLLGTELNWTSAISFAVLAGVLYFKWRAERFVAIEPDVRDDRQRSAPEAPKPQGFGRKVDVAGRARANMN